jgi:hypothetical protein
MTLAVEPVREFKKTIKLIGNKAEKRKKGKP